MIEGFAEAPPQAQLLHYCHQRKSILNGREQFSFEVEEEEEEEESRKFDVVGEVEDAEVEAVKA